MANFGVQLLGSIGAAFRSAGVIYVTTAAGNNRRINVYEINVGQVAASYASTDTSMLWDVSRIGASAGLAATLVTPNPMDGTGAASALSTYANLATAEAAVTTQGNGLSLYSWPINQRGFNRWRALDDGDNIVVPSVSQNGLAIRELCSGGAFGGSGIGTLAFGEA
jgi:hypothetical protein